MGGVKKAKTVVPLIILTLLIIGVGAYFFVIQKQSKKETITPQKQQVVKTVNAEDIGLTLKARSDSKAIIMKLTKLSGISSIEYEISYDAEVVEEGTKIKVPRGVVGSPIEIKMSDPQITREIELGTCSRNVCKYDKVVSEVKFVIKINYKNGEVGSLEEKVSL